MPSAVFFVAPTFALLGSGVLGALVATLGALTVAWLSIRSDRRYRHHDAIREDERQDELARRAVAAAHTTVTPAPEPETRWAPLLIGRTQRAVLGAVIEAHRLAFRRHPAVADWLWWQLRELQAMPRWSYSILLGAKRSRRYAAFAQRWGQLLAAIQGWTIGRRDDDWFADEFARRGVEDK